MLLWLLSTITVEWKSNTVTALYYSHHSWCERAFISSGHCAVPSHNFDIHSILTMPQLRFLSTLQKVWGGVSPLFVMMTQMSVTASEFWGWTGGARRIVMNIRWEAAELLLTFAQRPNGVAWMISQPWMRRSLPSYSTLWQITKDKKFNTHWKGKWKLTHSHLLSSRAQT